MSVLDPIHQAFAEVGPPNAIFGPPKLRIVVGALVMGFVGCVQLLLYCFPPDAVRAGQQADPVGLLIMGIGCLAMAGGIAHVQIDR